MGVSVFDWGREGAVAGHFAIIIPARFGSTRYPGKPLAMLTGADGRARTLIERSWRAACAVAGAGGVWVATDDLRVAGVVRGFGGQVVMTSPACRNGTERCAQAARLLALPHEIIVNFQGDAPLIPPQVVEGVVEALRRDPGAGMATAAMRCCARTYAHLREEAAQGRTGGVCVVVDEAERALYFSRRMVPFVPEDVADAHRLLRLHLGLYAYRAEALADYARGEPCMLEEMEGLEQLRCLARGIGVRVLSFDPDGPMVELNNPQDVGVMEDVLLLRGVS